MVFPKSKPNYPDILGYLTGGTRFSVDHVECAVAALSNTVMTGEIFTLFVLMQNTVDVRVTTTISLDVSGGALLDEILVPRTHQMRVLLRPAEVGFAMIPIAVRPSARRGKFSLDVTVGTETGGEAKTIRTTSKQPPSLDYYFNFSEQALARITKLRKLTFHTGKRGLFNTGMLTGMTGMLFSPRLALPLQIKKSERKTHLPPKGADWMSLWSLDDNADSRHLLERNQKQLEDEILPQLTRKRLSAPFYQTTMSRFSKAGYTISEVEGKFITRLLVHMLETVPDRKYLYEGEAYFDLVNTLREGWSNDGLPVDLPGWCRSFLNLLASRPNLVQNVPRTLADRLYDEVLRDAVIHGFSLIHHFMNIELGTHADITAYGDQIVRMLWDPDIELTFTDVYLPLVVGGVLVLDNIRYKDEHILKELNLLADASVRNRVASDDQAFQLIDRIISVALRKYGYHM